MTETRPTKARGTTASASSDKTHVNESTPDETPLDYMLRIMRDPTADNARRDAMAKAACVYINTRTAGTEGGIMNTQEFRELMEMSRESIASSIARLRPETA
jgi:hypothetical protein